MINQYDKDRMAKLICDELEDKKKPIDTFNLFLHVLKNMVSSEAYEMRHMKMRERYQSAYDSIIDNPDYFFKFKYKINNRDVFSSRYKVGIVSWLKNIDMNDRKEKDVTTDITIIESCSKFANDELDNLIKVNESLKAEIKRLRKEKEHLHEQLCLIKKFSDGLWDRLRIDI